MTATVDVEPERGSPEDDAVTDWLGEVLSALNGLAAGTACVPRRGPSQPDRPAGAGEGRRGRGAVRCAEIVGFARSQVAQQQTDGVNYRRLGQGIAEQVGLATRTSGWHGARRLTLARDLVQELPQTFGLLAAGRLSEYLAQLVVTETSHLDPDVRREVDGQLVAQHVDEGGPKAAAGLARKLAYAADPQGAVKRARKAREDRHVSLRPAPDTMTACSGEDQPVELNLTVPLEHLIDPDDQTPADIPGYGPIPAGLADEIIGRAGAGVAAAAVSPLPPATVPAGWSSGGDWRLRLFGNGRGLCERHNYARQPPGWKVEVLHRNRYGTPEVIATTTPTGHTYLSRAPNPPRYGPRSPSPSLLTIDRS